LYAGFVAVSTVEAVAAALGAADELDPELGAGAAPEACAGGVLGVGAAGVAGVCALAAIVNVIAKPKITIRIQARSERNPLAAGFVVIARPASPIPAFSSGLPNVKIRLPT
jgi:hypothetical protein